MLNGSVILLGSSVGGKCLFHLVSEYNWDNVRVTQKAQPAVKLDWICYRYVDVILLYLDSKLVNACGMWRG